MDEATANLIFEILLQDSLDIYEEQQAQSSRAHVRQEEIDVTTEDSGELNGYD